MNQPIELNTTVHWLWHCQIVCMHVCVSVAPLSQSPKIQSCHLLHLCSPKAPKATRAESEIRRESKSVFMPAFLHEHLNLLVIAFLFSNREKSPFFSEILHSYWMISKVRFETPRQNQDARMHACIQEPEDSKSSRQDHNDFFFNLNTTASSRQQIISDVASQHLPKPVHEHKRTHLSIICHMSAWRNHRGDSCYLSGKLPQLRV